ncbi:hypothetical protein GEU84_007715 [Fertoebacter nigrum]|uniref:Thiol:disulfide interchange protein DsbD N-terminal domain-containing protein n=1 Tax=Fertoeibacter niger TaxID=2656921 RepID=A0A8X8KNP7_9RHOB|nr:protein-disulfide reductase DsbD domain-containing protein [Fertoeibacter niger]NUB44265.1 hypothetical protein [Fertoeibacter niger]
MIKSIALSALLGLSALPALAWQPADIVQADLLPGWREPDGRHMAALRLSLAPKWKTYWRSPGEAGIPPQFDWAGSQNLKSVRFHWPRPIVFHQNGMQTIGYSRELVLPLELTAIDPAKPILLRGTVDLGVCRDICMPATLDVRADLPAKGAPDAAISAALRAAPTTGRAAGLAQISCRVEPIADGLRITAVIDMPSMGGDEVVVVEPGQASVWTAGAVSQRDGNRLTATTEMVGPGGAPFALDRSALTLTVLGEARAVEIKGCPAP